ncbi:MAG: WYL domain-containing protein [Myxococcota bacterium]
MTKNHRTAKLLIHLFEHGGFTTAEAAAMCGVSARLVRDDISTLRDQNVPIRSEGTGRTARWVFDAPSTLGRLDRISLMVGREVTRFLEGTSLHRGFDQLRELAITEAQAHRIRYLPEPARQYGPSDEIVDTCLDALLRARALEVDYRRPAGDVTYDRFEPLTLVVYRRSLYLVGRMKERVYTLAIDRIVEARVGDAFAYPADWELDRWLAGRFGLTLINEQFDDVVLEFSAAVAHLVRAREWHPSQSVHDLPEGKVLLTMHTAGSELVRFVLEWGKQCRVLGPTWLRDQVVDELRVALAGYGEPS